MYLEAVSSTWFDVEKDDDGDIKISTGTVDGDTVAIVVRKKNMHHFNKMVKELNKLAVKEEFNFKARR